MKLILLFVALNIVNVIIQTIKSLTTISSGKWVAGITNSIAYGFYTIVVVYTMCELPLWLKVAVVAFVNLFGVVFSKYLFEKFQKDKLWKVEVSVLSKYQDDVLNKIGNIPFSYIENLGKYTLFNFYCATQKESKIVKDLCKDYGAKFFATESKNL